MTRPSTTYLAFLVSCVVVNFITQKKKQKMLREVRKMIGKKIFFVAFLVIAFLVINLNAALASNLYVRWATVLEDFSNLAKPLTATPSEEFDLELLLTGQTGSGSPRYANWANFKTQFRVNFDSGRLELLTTPMHPAYKTTYELLAPGVTRITLTPQDAQAVQRDAVFEVFDHLFLHFKVKDDAVSGTSRIGLNYEPGATIEELDLIREPLTIWVLNPAEKTPTPRLILRPQGVPVDGKLLVDVYASDLPTNIRWLDITFWALPCDYLALQTDEYVFSGGYLTPGYDSKYGFGINSWRLDLSGKENDLATYHDLKEWQAGKPLGTILLKNVPDAVLIKIAEVKGLAKYLAEDLFIISPSPPISNIIGDVDFDGTVDWADLVPFIEKIEKLEKSGADYNFYTPLFGGPFFRADVNGDGRTNTVDFLWLLLYLLGEIDKLPAEDLYAAAPSATGSGTGFLIEMLKPILEKIPDPKVKAIVDSLIKLTATKTTSLLQNFPNPFNPETWIPYQLKETTEVDIKIYNVAGELIRALNLGQKAAGAYTSKNAAAYWDGKNEAGEQVSSGVYFYNIRAGDFNATKKMVINK